MPLDKFQIIRKMLELGLIDRDTLTRVLLICKSRNINVLNVLANYAGMSIDEIRKFVEDHFDVPALDLEDLALNPEIVRMVPKDVAMEHQMVPAFRILSRLHLAVANPFDLDGINRIKGFVGENSDIFLAPETQVMQVINKYQSI
jgi:type IV pilus assembly protein PilB